MPLPLPLHQFAPVGPHHLLSKLTPITLGKYHLVLAHDIVEHQKEWRTLLPPNSLVILDNSIIELGRAVAVQAIVEAYWILKDSPLNYRIVVVPPEVIDDPDETNSLFISNHPVLEDKLEPGVEMMYVIQGPGLRGLEKSLSMLWHRLREFPNLTWVGVPRSLVPECHSRMWATLECFKMKLVHPRLNIHMLGFSDNIQDDIACTAIPGVAGIDSAVPLRLGQKGQKIDLTYEGDQAGPRGDYWNIPQEMDIMTLRNIYAFKSAVQRRMSDETGFTPTLNSKYDGIKGTGQW